MPREYIDMENAEPVKWKHGLKKIEITLTPPYRDGIFYLTFIFRTLKKRLFRKPERYIHQTDIPLDIEELRCLQRLTTMALEEIQKASDNWDAIKKTIYYKEKASKE
jgi:hypothetical protein